MNKIEEQIKRAEQELEQEAAALLSSKIAKHTMKMASGRSKRTV